MRALRAGSYRVVPGEHYGTPKEVWGFRLDLGSRRPTDAARELLEANARLFDLEGRVASLKRRACLESLGATHVILQQRHRGVAVHRGFVTVHIAHSGHAYLVKNRAVPEHLLGGEPDFELSPARAAELAAQSVVGRSRKIWRVTGTEQRWYPLKARLVPTWRVRLSVSPPREEWIVYVHAVTGKVVSYWDNLATARASALVFDPNPVVALGGERALLDRAGRVRAPPAEAYSLVTLHDLLPGRHLDGKRVSTRLTRGRARRADGRFLFQSGELGFAESMVYFHVDRAIRYLEDLGYAGQRRIFRRPIEVDVRATRDDQSWYDPSTKTLSFGTGGVDDAEDGETILHELGHAIQDAICGDFGQSREAAAMGEGFGDYFAASFFAERKRGRYRAAVMSWDAITEGGHPPALRRLDEPFTFAAFRPRGDEHDNGPIWASTLWDVRSALGRETADRLIIDSHFQLDGFTTFARGARAILDADRNLFRGRHVRTLRRIFRKRRIGPV